MVVLGWVAVRAALLFLVCRAAETRVANMRKADLVQRALAGTCTRPGCGVTYWHSDCCLQRGVGIPTSDNERR